MGNLETKMKDIAYISTTKFIDKTAVPVIKANVDVEKLLEGVYESKRV